MRVSLRTKIISAAIFPLVITIIISTVISVSSIISEGNERIDNRRKQLTSDIKTNLKQQIDIAVNSINKFHSGGDNEESRKIAMDTVRAQVYGESGYFWINDFQQRMIVHPFSPHLEGKEMKGTKDPNGILLFEEFVKVAKEKGEGIVTYMWPKPGFKDPQPKISYVKAFKPWGWVIGTGVYVDDIERKIAEEKSKINAAVNGTILRNTLVGLLLLLVIGSFTFFFVNRNIVRRIYQLVESLKKVGETGDFSNRVVVEGNDEIAESKVAFNQMVSSFQIFINNLSKTLSAIASGDLSQNVTEASKGDLEELRLNANESISLLTNLIFDIKEASIQVNSGADELALSSQGLAAGSSQQAASAEEISSSMSQLGAQTKNNSDNARTASQLSQEMLNNVSSGNEQMTQLMASMKEINETSLDVGKIIKVVDEIAFQTNLLALNAAVEAARAGKYGKGFSVVADEVRNLASRSAEAAKSTMALIETSVKKVEKGVSNSDKTAQILKEINENAKKVNSLVSNIAIASVEQINGIEEVNKGLSQINNVVQQNASISEESASASEELSALSMQLKDMLGKFKVSKSLGYLEKSGFIEMDGKNNFVDEEIEVVLPDQMTM